MITSRVSLRSRRGNTVFVAVIFSDWPVRGPGRHRDKTRRRPPRRLPTELMARAQQAPAGDARRIRRARRS